MQALKYAFEARVADGAVPAGRLRAWLGPPGTQRIDEVHVKQPVKECLLPWPLGGRFGGEQPDRRRVRGLQPSGGDDGGTGEGRKQGSADAALKHVGTAQDHRVSRAIVRAAAAGLRDRLRGCAGLADEPVGRARGHERDVPRVQRNRRPVRQFKHALALKQEVGRQWPRAAELQAPRRSAVKDGEHRTARPRLG